MNITDADREEIEAKQKAEEEIARRVEQVLAESKEKEGAREFFSGLLSGIIAAATSLGAVLANHTGDNIEITNVMLITTAVAFIVHSGKEWKKYLKP
jgi:hypothetical protein